MWESGSGALGGQVAADLHFEALRDLNFNEHAPHTVQIGK
jgi:hypothetical protein